MDIVYLLGHSKFDEFYIQNSIRLLRKNLTGFNKIFVIGRNPEIKDVIFYEFPDPNTKNVEANMIRKIFYACNSPFISDPFIFMSDDYFILKPLDVKDIDIGWKYDLSVEKPNSTYGRRCVNTYKVCKKLGIPTLNYQCHRPVLIDKQKYFMAYSNVSWDKEDEGLLCFSIYGNMFRLGRQVEDSKTALLYAKEDLIKLSKLQMISTDDDPSNKIKEFIQNL